MSGPSGCGKSTLALALAGFPPGPAGGRSVGVVEVCGRAPDQWRGADRVVRIGFVDQRPDDQILTGTIGEEVTFAARSTGWSPARSRAAGERALADVDLKKPWNTPVSELSGGERQRLVLAAAIATRPSFLVLDEPLAHLDPEGAQRILVAIRRFADAGGAVLLVEHRRRLALPFADESVALAPDLESPGPRPRRPRPDLAPMVKLESLEYRYHAGAPWVFRGVGLTIGRGERVAIIGPNGAGKSTLLRLVRRAARSRVRVVAVPQDPDLALSSLTVAGELAVGAAARRRSIPDVVQRAAVQFGLEDLLPRAPASLSRGERLRVAIAAATTAEPDLLVLDEPTAGQDPARVAGIMAALDNIEALGLLFATHDLELADAVADRVLILSDGHLRERR